MAINSFESGLSRLSEIDVLLQSEDVGLEQTVSLYEEAVKLIDKLTDELNYAKLRFETIKADKKNND